MPLSRQQTDERSRSIPFQFETQFKLLNNSAVRRLCSDNGAAEVAVWELYNLIKDSGETINIAAEQPKVLSSMQAERTAWQDSLRNTLAE